MHGLAGRYGDIRHGAHAHHIAFPDMGMEFHHAGRGAGGGDQPIRRCAIIAKRQEARAIGIGPGSAGPWVADHKVALGDIMMRERSRGRQAKDQGAKGAAVQGGHEVFLLSNGFSHAARGQCRPAFAA